MPAVITDQPPIISPEASTLMLSAQMLAKRLAIPVRTLWRLRSAGKIPPPIRLGGAVRWRTRPTLRLGLRRAAPILHLAFPLPLPSGYGNKWDEK